MRILPLCLAFRIIFPILVPQTLPLYIIPSTTTPIAAMQYILNCELRFGQEVPMELFLHWAGSNQVMITNNTLANVFTFRQSSTAISLVFDPLKSEHKGRYVCLATLSHNSSNFELTGNVSASISLLSMYVYVSKV